jgi:hypothetical protein
MGHKIMPLPPYFVSLPLTLSPRREEKKNILPSPKMVPVSEDFSESFYKASIYYDGVPPKELPLYVGVKPILTPYRL